MPRDPRADMPDNRSQAEKRAGRQYVARREQEFEQNARQGYNMEENFARMGSTGQKGGGGQPLRNKYSQGALFSTYGGGVSGNYEYDWDHGQKLNIATSDKNSGWEPISPEEMQSYRDQETFNTSFYNKYGKEPSYYDRLRVENGWLPTDVSGRYPAHLFEWGGAGSIPNATGAGGSSGVGSNNNPPYYVGPPVQKPPVGYLGPPEQIPNNMSYGGIGPITGAGIPNTGQRDVYHNDPPTNVPGMEPSGEPSNQPFIKNKKKQRGMLQPGSGGKYAPSTGGMQGMGGY